MVLTCLLAGILPSLNAVTGSEDMDMSDTEGSSLLSGSVPVAEAYQLSSVVFAEPSVLGYHLGRMQDNNILVLKRAFMTRSKD